MGIEMGIEPTIVINDWNLPEATGSGLLWGLHLKYAHAAYTNHTAHAWPDRKVQKKVLKQLMCAYVIHDWFSFRSPEHIKLCHLVK